MKRSGVKILIVACLVGLLSGADSDARQLGQVYPIIEKDAHEEVMARAQAFDSSRYRESVKNKVLTYRPQDMVRLPQAQKSRIFTVDMSQTVSRDLKDQNGRVLVAKGSTINPLAKMNWPGKLLFIDGSSKAQMRWLLSSTLAKDISVKIVLTDGDYIAVREKLGRPVFYANRLLVDRLRIAAVPSLVRQNGLVMEVREIDVKTDR